MMSKTEYEKEINLIKKQQDLSDCTILVPKKDSETFTFFAVFNPNKSLKGTGRACVYKSTLYEKNAAGEIVSCSIASPYPSERVKFVVKQSTLPSDDNLIGYYKDAYTREYEICKDSLLASRPPIFFNNIAYLPMRRIPGKNVYQFLLDLLRIELQAGISEIEQICKLISRVEKGIIYEIVNALIVAYDEQIASKDWVHFDIKDENILLKWTTTGIKAFFVDLEMIMKTGELNTHGWGTEGWQAPELEQAYEKPRPRSIVSHPAIDIFSLGKLFALLCGFYGSEQAFDQNKETGNISCDEILKDLIINMMQKNPEDRPDIKTIKDTFMPDYENNRVRNMPQRTLKYFLERKICDRRAKPAYSFFMGRVSVGLTIKKELERLTHIVDVAEFTEELKKFHAQTKNLAGQKKSLHSIAKKFVPIIEEMLEYKGEQRLPLPCLV